MAVLTGNELEAIRQRIFRYLTRTGGAVNYTKPQINGALQALEDAFQSVSNVGPRSLKTHIANAIETAQPTVFTTAQKDKLFALWCYFHADREGVI